ncbi:MAG: hypothetical protein E7331_12635 [Clostridiales bacterium]|nr:hypothetical protein [Clostridiales bacterium]
MAELLVLVMLGGCISSAICEGNPCALETGKVFQRIAVNAETLYPDMQFDVPAKDDMLNAALTALLASSVAV